MTEAQKLILNIIIDQMYIDGKVSLWEVAYEIQRREGGEAADQMFRVVGVLKSLRGMKFE
jgi:hypothetical protein